MHVAFGEHAHEHEHSPRAAGGSRCAQVLRHRGQGAIGSKPTRVTVHKISDTCNAAKSVHPIKGTQHA